jgi:hypothetical protein
LPFATKINYRRKFVENTIIFTGHPKPLKVILFLVETVENRFYFWLIIFGAKYRRK